MSTVTTVLTCFFYDVMKYTRKISQVHITKYRKYTRKISQVHMHSHLDTVNAYINQRFVVRLLVSDELLDCPLKDSE